jgi:hypothetical protein
MQRIITGVIGAILVILIVVLILSQMANLPMWSSSQSNAIASAGTALTDFLSIFAMMIAGIIVIVALGRAWGR